MATAQPLQEKRSKWRLSNLVKPGHSKDKDTDVVTTQDSELNEPDSAYGGSDTMNSTSSNSAENVPTITKDQANAQGAPTKTHVDNRGRVITTTTTTTTTTVTTMGGDQVTVPAGKEVVVSREDVPTELSARPVSRGPGEEDPQSGSPSIPVKDQRRRSKSPLAISQSSHRLSGQPGEPITSMSPTRQNFSYPARTPPPHTTARLDIPPPVFRSSYVSDEQNVPEVPPIPQGVRTSAQGNRYYGSDVPPLPTIQVPGASPNQRYSYGNDPSNVPRKPVTPPPVQYPSQQQQHPPYQNPISPVNSSRPRPPVEPSQGQPRLNGEPPREYTPYNREPAGQPSTLQSLKIAAAGIHGAGETLRGALNSNIERRTGGSAQSIAAHNAVMERGRQEIETGQFHHAPAPAPAPAPVIEPDEAIVPEERERKKSRLRNVLRKKSRSRDGLERVPE